MCGTYLLVLDHSNLKFTSCADPTIGAAFLTDGV
jgi:hypothetical protein